MDDGEKASHGYCRLNRHASIYAQRETPALCEQQCLGKARLPEVTGAVERA